MSSQVLIGLMFLAVAVAAVVWGVIIFLECRAHRNDMDDLEGRWK